MKKILILICALCGTSVFAQTVQDIGKIVLGIKIMDNATSETHRVGVQLQSKLNQLVTLSGYSSYGNSQFVISPNVIINAVDKAEGGMKTVYVVQGELALSVNGGDENVVYSSLSLPFRGSGISMDKAIMDAILKINYNTIKGWDDEARSKILNYYSDRGEMIFTKADMYACNQEYDKAIACLMMIPEELFELHTKALKKAIEVYDMRNEDILKQQAENIRFENDVVLKKAQSYLSMHNPEDALKALWAYRSGDSRQNAQYDTIVKKSEALISAEKKLALEKERQEYHDARMREDREWVLHERKVEHSMAMDKRAMDYDFALLEVEKQTEQLKVDAIKSITCEFLKNNPDLINTLN